MAKEKAKTVAMTRAMTAEPAFINVLEPSEFSEETTMLDHLRATFDNYDDRITAQRLVMAHGGWDTLYWECIKHLRRSSQLAKAWNAMRVDLGYTEIVDR